MHAGHIRGPVHDQSSADPRSVLEEPTGDGHRRHAEIPLMNQRDPTVVGDDLQRLGAVDQLDRHVQPRRERPRTRGERHLVEVIVTQLSLSRSRNDHERHGQRDDGEKLVHRVPPVK